MKISFKPAWTSLGVPMACARELSKIEEPYKSFFDKREYGKSCIAIEYSLFCVNTEIFDNFTEEMFFDDGVPEIVCSVEVGYKAAMNAT